MVLPAPAAAAEEAGWLTRLRRSLVFGSGPRLVVLRAAGPEHLRPVAEMLANLGPSAVCLRFSEVWDVSPGSFVVYALQPDDLAAANLARPLFREHDLRAVLLLSDLDYGTARLRAPDLIDWASTTIEAEPVIPGFVAESIWLFSAHFPGFAWAGEVAVAEAALSHLYPGALVRVAPTPRHYDALVEALAIDDEWCLVPVATEADALRLRLALAEAGRRAPTASSRVQGRVVAVGRSVPGWPTVDPRVADWSALLKVDRRSATNLRMLNAELSAIDTPEMADTEARLDAISGLGPAQTVRQVLVAEDISSLRRRRDARARTALRNDDAGGLHHVAAWAERARKAPVLTDVSPRLGAAALAATLRLMGPDAEAQRIATALWWPELASRWWPGATPAPTSPAAAAAAVELASAQVRGLKQAADVTAVLPADFGNQAQRGPRSKRPPIDALLRAASTDDERALLMQRLAIEHWRAGQLDDARRWLDRTLAVWGDRLGTEHPKYLSALLDLAVTLEMDGWIDEARSRLDQVLLGLPACSARGVEAANLRRRVAIALVSAGRLGEAAQVLSQLLSTLAADVASGEPSARFTSAAVASSLMASLALVARTSGRHGLADLYQSVGKALDVTGHSKVGNTAAFEATLMASFVLESDAKGALAWIARARGHVDPTAPAQKSADTALAASERLLSALVSN